MLCSAFFTMQMFLGNYTVAVEMKDARMEAVVGVSETKEADLYMAYIVTTDTLTGQLAAAKGYSETEQTCQLQNGQEATIYAQFRRSRRV